ncbi:hypothetical protein DIRU0_E33936 [Diutina rugosa]
MTQVCIDYKHQPNLEVPSKFTRHWSGSQQKIEVKEESPPPPLGGPAAAKSEVPRKVYWPPTPPPVSFQNHRFLRSLSVAGWCKDTLIPTIDVFEAYRWPAQGSLSPRSLRSLSGGSSGSSRDRN